MRALRKSSRKRKPDLRLIRPTKTYKPEEIAQTLRRSLGTVRRWLRDGLPTLGGPGSPLVEGEALRAWLKQRWASRKTKCGSDELFCFKCQAPRRPQVGSVSVKSRNAKTLSISAKCGECGTRMHQAGAVAKRTEIVERFRAFATETSRIAGCDDPIAERTFSESSAGPVSSGAGTEQIPPQFTSSTGTILH